MEQNRVEKFKFIDITTADVAFEAYGSTLSELFENAALAMMEVMVNTKQIKPKKKVQIELKDEDLKGLLFSWLNELLFYYGSEGLVFSKFEVEVDASSYSLKASCLGEPINPEKHEIRTEVKAATYHRMEIRKEGDKWVARVILDI